MHHNDPEDPPGSPKELSTNGSILPQTCHHVGTTLSASASLSGPGDRPRPLIMHAHLLPAPPGLLAKGLRKRSPASGLLAPSLTLISVPQARWGAASCMACGPEQPRRLTSPGPKNVPCSSGACWASWGRYGVGVSKCRLQNPTGVGKSWLGHLQAGGPGHSARPLQSGRLGG